MITLLRVVRFAFQHVGRSFWLALITVSLLALTLLTINAILALSAAAQSVTRSIEERVDVSLYFQTGVPEETVQQAAGYLRGLPQVRNVEIVTPEEALERFEERHEKDDTVLASVRMLETNPFGYALVVRTRSASDFAFLREAADHPQFRPFIRETDMADYGPVLERLSQTTDRARAFGLGLSGLFLLISILIIFNTVRIAIFIHREEIAVMRLVGAAGWFIRAPYFIEAVLLSAVATVLAAAVVFPVLLLLQPKLDLFFASTPAKILPYFLENGWTIFGLEFVGLALVSVLSAAFAMRRHLRV
ncbi:MAG TPA: permease-like cell division protein FtsX [Patescibacteria group bacterium]|nr:permease-like cell division protein FtsX [Patescibacteria group bacterium]